MSTLSDLSKYGYIPTFPELTSKLSSTANIFLGHVIVSLNYAQKHNVAIDNDFLMDINRALTVLKFDIGDLDLSEQELSEAGFIECFDSDVEGCSYIRVNLNHIHQAIQTEKERRCFGSWDDGLLYSLNPNGRKLNFCSTTLEIKQFLDEKLNNSGTVPLIYYSKIDEGIREYERLVSKLSDGFDLYGYLFKNVCKASPDAAREGFSRLINLIVEANNRNTTDDGGENV